MIYNLSEYVRIQTGVTPITNGLDPVATQDQLTLIQTSGSDLFRGLREDILVQVKSSSVERTSAYRLVQIVYNLLRNRFGVLMPEVTVDGDVYPAVTAVQMLPMQKPGYIGTDNNGYHQWSVNFRVTIGGN